MTGPNGPQTKKDKFPARARAPAPAQVAAAIKLHKALLPKVIPPEMADAIVNAHSRDLANRELATLEMPDPSPPLQDFEKILRI